MVVCDGCGKERITQLYCGTCTADLRKKINELEDRLGEYLYDNAKMEKDLKERDKTIADLRIEIIDLEARTAYMPDEHRDIINYKGDK